MRIGCILVIVYDWVTWTTVRPSNGLLLYLGAVKAQEKSLVNLVILNSGYSTIPLLA